MSELLAESDLKQGLVKNLTHQALDELDHLYGPDSRNPKPYHNRAHTERMWGAADWMTKQAIREGLLSEDDLYTMRFAAAYHDFVRGLDHGKNEAESARQAKRAMESSHVFTDTQIAQAGAMIEATTVVDDNGRMHQSASPDDLMQQILCDADLAYLGSSVFDDFWPKALDFLREQLGKKPDEELSEEEIEVFAQEEIDFLQNHQFYTKYAAMYAPGIEQNIRFLQEGRYKGFKAPEPIDWEEITKGKSKHYSS